MTIALYPGSFDPVTNGHLDIVHRASDLFDQLVVGIYDVPKKNLMFNNEERAELMEKAVAHMSNVRVSTYSGLTVEFARAIGAKVLVRGLRMTSDFEKEFGMALMNKTLAHDIELVCFMTNLEYQFISSSLLKEACQLGGNVSSLVPEHVVVALRKKFGLDQ